MFGYEQGDILKIEHFHYPVMVVSNNFFNKSGKAIVCPIAENVIESALHRRVDTIDFSGTVLCEQMKYLDLDKRGFSMIAHVSINEIIDISDILQGVFEYVEQ